MVAGKHVVEPYDATVGASTPGGLVVGPDPWPTQALVLQGATDIETAMGTLNDNQFLFYSGTHPNTEFVSFTLFFDNEVNSASQVMEAINFVDRQETSLQYGSFYPAEITGFTGSDAHSFLDFMHWRTDYGFGVYATNFYAPTSQAADGTLWEDCDRFEVTVKLWAFGAYQADGSYTYGHGVGGTNRARMTYGVLEQHYTERPVVTGVSPSGSTVTVPQPTVSWATTVGAQTSYQVAIVPQGIVDGNGVAAGAAGFDPDTVADLTYLGYNSGKVRSHVTTIQSPHALPNGNYLTYVRAWTASPYHGEIVGNWTAGSLFTVNSTAVNPPAIAVAEDSATYTVKVTVSPGTPVGGGVHPQLYEVQTFNLELGIWEAAEVPNGGMVTGNATTIIYDGFRLQGTAVSYRTRGRYVRPTDGLTAVTSWVTGSVTLVDRKEWWLRALADPTLNRSLNSFSTLTVRSWSGSRSRPQNVDYGIGAKYPSVTYDVTKSQRMELSVWAMSAAGLASLRALLEHDGDLVLVTPWAEMWRVQVGDEVQEEPQVSAPRAGETTPIGLVRVVTFSLTEVA